MNKLPYLFAFTLGLAAAQALTITESAGWLESAYAKWSPESGATSYSVYYTGGGVSNQKIDDALIRNYGTYYRADIPGLAQGSYTITVKPVTSGTEGTGATTGTLSVIAHDRSGFAFSGSRVPGGYTSSGTPKSGAVILYVTNSNKDNISLAVTTSSSGTTTTCTGLQAILDGIKKGYETRPIIIRLIGTITDPVTTYDGDIVIENAQTAAASLTVEGIGDDATVNGWGIRLKNASNIEVRNIGIMNVNSGEGDNIGLQQNNDHIWVHNVDFFYGDAGSDADQVKGDGALDCKKSTYITFSYNHFWDNGKSNLLGLSEGTTSGLYITYHHNWYDHSDSRHPRVRYYSAHVYNNFYDGNAKYGIGSTLGSSVFSESNYYRNCKYPMLTSLQGSDVYAGGTARDPANYGTFSGEAGGTIKSYNNYMTGTYTFIPYGATSYTAKGSTVTASAQGITTTADFDAYVVTNRNEIVPGTVKSYSGSNTYNNFDVDAAIMYTYAADAPEAAMAKDTTYAGRVKGGDFKWIFNDASEDTASAVNTALKSALSNYATKLVSIQGETGVVYTSSTSTATSSSATATSSSATIVPSSSSAAVSSSSVTTGSSSSAAATSGKAVITSSITHDFTSAGTLSDYISFTGNLSTFKGTLVLNGDTLSTCLKMESGTNISFTLGSSATLTLYFLDSFTGTVKIDGTAYTATGGVVTLTLTAGAHVITKSDAAYLYYISIAIGSGTTAVKADIAQNSVQFSLQGNSLFIAGEGIRRAEVFSANGMLIKSATLSNTSEASFCGLKNGVYMVRVQTARGIVTRPISVR